MIHLDTHVVVWLFVDGRDARLSPVARKAIQVAQQVEYSPAVRLELQFLLEIGRLKANPSEVLSDLGSRMGLRECQSSFPAVAAAAAAVDWTRDPFDRMIVGQANLTGASLVTRDRIIRAHLDTAIW